MQTPFVQIFVPCLGCLGNAFNICLYYVMRHIFPLVLIGCLLSVNIARAETENYQELEESFCANGSQQQLLDFFTEQQYVVIAQGKRINEYGTIKEFHDVLFLLSPDMEFFHLVTQEKVSDSKYKACIFSSAREVDYKFTSPVPDLLPEINREHLMFLNTIPKDGECPVGKLNCVPWSKWSHMIKQTFLFSAYMYSGEWNYDAYEEIVDLTLDGKTIHPTRGALSKLARAKYAARLRHELDEEKGERESAMKAYTEIYKEADHGLPLVMLMLTDNRKWAITIVDRGKGLVWTPMQGRDLELYPLPRTVYERFLSENK